MCVHVDVHGSRAGPCHPLTNTPVPRVCVPSASHQAVRTVRLVTAPQREAL